MRRQVRLLVVISTIGFLGRLSYEMLRSPVTPLYAHHLGAPPALIGLIVAAATITGIFVKMPAGALADSFGFRRLMFLGTIPKAVGPFLYSLAVTPPLLFIVRMFHGLSTALYAPPASALVAKLFPTARGRYLGIYSAAENAGVVLGPLVGGGALVAMGFLHTFWLSGLIGIVPLVLGIALLSRRVPEDQPKKATQALPDIRKALGEIARNRAVLFAALAEGSLFFGFGSLQAFLPLYAVTQGVDPASIGLIFAAQGLATLVARPIFGHWSDVIGRKPMIVAGLSVAALVVAAVPWLSSTPALVLVGGMFGLASGAVTPAGAALIADVAKGNNLGAAMGTFGSLWDVGHALGPIVTGILRGFLPYRAVFTIVAVVLVVALALFGSGVRESRSAVH